MKEKMRKRDLEHILIVDDEQDICLLVKSILKRNSEAKIDVAYSTREAKEKLQKNNYDLVFFDLRLQDGTGIDLIKFTQATIEKLPYIAVISAYTSSVDVNELEELKINEFIPKPLSSKKIINCFLAASA